MFFGNLILIIIQAKKVKEKTIEKGAPEATTTCNFAKIVNEDPGSPWSHYRSYLFFENKANLTVSAQNLRKYFETLLVMAFEPLFFDL